MCARQEFKQQHSHSSGNEVENGLGSQTGNGNLVETSREGIGRLLQRAKAGMKWVNDLQPNDSVGMPKSGSRVDAKQEVDKRVTWNDIDAAGCSRDTMGDASRDVDEGKLLDDGQEMDHSDWEDGSIPVANFTDNHPESRIKGVTVEFETADSDDSVRRKPTRRASAEDKEMAELVHKVHLLCLLARGRIIDRVCDDLLIQASLLSVIPKQLLEISEVSQLNVKALYYIVKWFHDNFHVGNSVITGISFHSALAHAIEHREGSPEEIAALSVALFRALKLTTRFVSILDVASLKPEADKNESSSRDGGVARGIFSTPTLMVPRTPRTKAVSTSVESSLSSKKKNACKASSSSKKKNACKASSSSSSKCMNSNSTNNGIRPESSPLADKLKARKSDSPSVACHDNSKACLTKESEGVKRKGKGDFEFEMQLEMALASTAVGTHKKNRVSSSASSPVKRNQISSVETSTSFQGISTVVGSRKVGAPLYWAEVYCNAENLTGRWVHVDAANAIIDGEQKVEAAAAACKTSLRYVVAFAGCGAKDVTRRYCMKWYKIAPKRVNSVWWDAVLAPLRNSESGVIGSSHDGPCYSNQNDFSKHINLPGNSVPNVHSSVAIRNSLEDMELETRALTEPLPTNQQAYKNHQLYAIERWLNKHQIIHPKGPILGFCSGHPVYPRTCMQTLKTKERWLREALQVRADEHPVKVIKNTAKLKKVRVSEVEDCEEVDSKGNIELYGKWQLEPLCLPRAVNGIVPRNERGQVDVWSEKCLPPGTVHLRRPRIFFVAKRLEIDYAPAMVGFEFRNGRSAPVFDGIVVCAEFKDILLEAYAEEEERRQAGEKKRKEAQAISRWYQLLSAIVTRQKLNNCYGKGSSLQMSTTGIQHTRNDKLNVPVGGIQESPEFSNIDTQYAKHYAPVAESEDHEHVYRVEDMSYDQENSVRTKRCHCGFSIQVEEL
ncbi:hypothetical protein Ddye_012328 [Dipteronia dyeriana]|uniref:DNA repair protein RAD4 n=1 Tax=Dipteronia dyeriana TaxID=168575 RepID=A0AAD9X479_9ROSI|nr:hypothetical protein Ddye_012328 [Dipteronia dyeriana]